MTLPTNTTINNSDDDSDMFGPPRSSPPIGYHYRSRVPMISPKLRQREERKRILQLCAHKLERIKDSEANLRRSVCINNTYSRLTDELRREKQNRYLSNLPKSENKPEQARDNIFSSYNTCNINNNNNSSTNFNDIIDTYPNANPNYHNNQTTALSNTTNTFSTGKPTATSIQQLNNIENYSTNCSSYSSSSYSCYTLTTTNTTTSSSCQYQDNNNNNNNNNNNKLKRSRNKTSSNNVDTDLEQLDRELSAIDASMPLIDPEITQGVEHLEKALSTRKRLRNEDDLVREALSQYYLPTQRLISAIDECPLEIKRPKNIYTIATNNPSTTLTCTLNNQLNLINNNNHHNGNCCSNMQTNNGMIHNDLELDLGLDLNSSSQKEFEVIMDALRLGTPSPTPDSCGVQAAMMGENCSNNLFNNLCVTSLET